jgi:hypothetical protein
MNKVILYLSGKKTYLTVLVGLSLGLAQALGYPIPGWVDVLCGFAGIGFQRLAIQKQSAQTTQDVSALLTVILKSVEDTKAK